MHHLHFSSLVLLSPPHPRLSLSLFLTISSVLLISASSLSLPLSFSLSFSLSLSLSLPLSFSLSPSLSLSFSLSSSLSLCISASARRLETYVLTPRRKGVMGPNAISSPCKFIEVCPDRQRSADTERHPQLTPLFIPAHLGPVKKSSGVHWRKTGFQRNGRERERV